MNLWPVLIFVGTFGPAALAMHVLLSKKRVYARWAQTAAVLAGVAGLGWGVFDYAVSHHFYQTKHGYFLLLAFKHNCAGLVVAFITSIALAYPSRKFRNSESANSAPPKT
jgi:hypothetical protein